METHCLLTESAELRVAVLRSEVSGGPGSLRRHYCPSVVLLFTYVERQAHLNVMTYEYEELLDGLRAIRRVGVAAYM